MNIRVLELIHEWEAVFANAELNMQLSSSMGHINSRINVVGQPISELELLEKSIYSGRMCCVVSITTIMKYIAKNPGLLINCIFQLGRFEGENEKQSGILCLYVFSNCKPESIKTSVYKWKTQTHISRYEQRLYEHRYFPHFIEYITIIENWLNDGVIPKNTNEYVFNEIEYSCYDNKYPFASRYQEETQEIINRLKRENTVSLSDMAYVIRGEISTRIRKTKDKAIYQNYMPSHGIYSLAVLHTRNRYETDVPLQKGDLLVSVADYDDVCVGFIDEEPSHPLCTFGALIIRCKSNVDPYYLYIYFNSDAGKKLLLAYLIPDVNITPPDYLYDLPIIYPDLSEQIYKDFFDSFYRKRGNISTYDSLINRLTVNSSSLDNELLLRIHSFRNQQAMRMVEQDLMEVQKCLSSGAYKAAVILSGSILEAFLIDWLGEINHVNYFEEGNEYIIKDRYTGRNKRADLIDYIDAIKFIRRPTWVVQAEHAHKIRKTRNHVHAKLCLNSDVQLNESTCNTILKYLVDIINTRYDINFPI